MSEVSVPLSLLRCSSESAPSKPVWEKYLTLARRRHSITLQNYDRLEATNYEGEKLGTIVITSHINGKVDERNIHRGYFRILDSLAADVVHGDANPLMRVVFRQAYAEQLIDMFVDEMPAPGLLSHRWRSAVLNPMLQRQLHGFGDDDPDGLRVHFESLSPVDQRLFYLKNDPLGESNRDLLRRSIMHVTTARWHLGLADVPDMSPEWFRKCEDATSKLIQIHQKHGYREEWLEYQDVVCRAENLLQHYSSECWVRYGRPFNQSEFQLLTGEDCSSVLVRQE